MKYVKLLTMTLLFAQFSSYGAGPAASATTPPASAADAAAGSPALAGAGAPISPATSFTPEATETMWKALTDGDFEGVEKIISGGRANVNAIDDSLGHTPITYLLANPKSNKLPLLPDIITMLLKYGADPALKDKHGQTALHVMGGLLPEHTNAIIKILLEKKPEMIDTISLDAYSNGLTGSPLLFAVVAPHNHAAIEALLKAGANPLLSGKRSWKSPWVEALTTLEDEKIINLFITHNPSIVNAPLDELGTTALQQAIIKNRPRLFNLLLNHGADVNKQDIFGNTPLIRAINNEERDFTHALLARGANPLIANNNGKNAFFYARNTRYEIRKGEILSLLHNHEATEKKSKAAAGAGPVPPHFDPAITKQMWDCLHGRASAEDLNAILATGQADVHATHESVSVDEPLILNNFNRLPLEHAVIHGNPVHVNMLIVHKTDPTVCNKYGKTILHSIATTSDSPFSMPISLPLEAGFGGSLEALLTHRNIPSIINAGDWCGVTPLMLAIEKGNTWFLPILLKHGADPFVTDRKGKNAFDYAADNVGALEILHKHQAFGATSAGTAPAAAAAATAPVSTAAAHSPKTALLPPALKASTHFDLFATRDMWEALYEKNLEKLHKALATERADTNLEDDTHGISPLEYSALNCKDPAFSLSAFTILLRKGADPVRPRNGSTPFHNIACAYSLYSDHMQILATHKDIHTIINVRKGNGKTPLICAIEARKPLSIIDPLLACGAEPLIADNDGCDARHYAQSNEALLKTINEHIARGKKAKSHAAALGTAPAKAGSGRGPAASYGAAAAAAGLAAASPAICTASAAAAGPLTPLRTPTPAMKESNRESLLVTATRALPALGLAAAAAAGLHTLAGSPPTPQLMLGAGPHMAAAAKPG